MSDLHTISEAPVASEPHGKPAKAAKNNSLWSDAWYDLRHNKVFVIGAVLALVLVVMAIFPGLFSPINAFDSGHCNLIDARKGITSEHWFGTDSQGCDTYARVIYGARISILVGILTSIITGLVGGALGLLAGYLGKWTDIILSRVAEVFFAIPSILGALLILSVVGRNNAGVWTVVMALSVLAWPMVLRIMRASVISTKNQDYITAARALGASPWRISTKHILPNAIAPVIVVCTMNLGVFIAAEAALSFLGVGIQSPGISWGLMISDGRNRFLMAPEPLLFPAIFLSITVLSFVMIGDAVRDALDPKLR